MKACVYDLLEACGAWQIKSLGKTCFFSKLDFCHSVRLSAFLSEIISILIYLNSNHQNPRTRTNNI